MESTHFRQMKIFFFRFSFFLADQTGIRPANAKQATSQEQSQSNGEIWNRLRTVRRRQPDTDGSPAQARRRTRKTDRGYQSRRADSGRRPPEEDRPGIERLRPEEDQMKIMDEVGTFNEIEPERSAGG